jgi:hypothetical protein
MHHETRLAGESDAESILRFKGRFYSSQRIQGYSVTQAHVAQGLGLGFQYAISEFSRCIYEPTMFEKYYYHFAGTVSMMEGSAPTVEKPQIYYKAYSSVYARCLESDTIFEIC